MTDLARLRMIVGQVTYKPGWEFRLDILYESSLHVSVVLRVTHREKDVGSDKEVFLSLAIGFMFEEVQGIDDKEFVERYVYRLIRDAELHELDEWLKFRGEHLHEPHPEEEHKWTGQHGNKNLTRNSEERQ